MNEQLSLINAKMKIPAPRKGYIRRRALFAKLKNIEDYKVIVVQGGAGCGKSTLLASFIRENPDHGWEWITLDPNNNEPFSFWYYVFATVKNRLGDAQQDVLSLFDTIIHQQDIEKIVSILVNELDAERPLTLVFDDFHHISDPFLLQTIQLFLKYSPASVRLVFMTREEPKLYLGDFIVAGNVLEITEEHLRLCDEEASAFLQSTLQLDVDEKTVDHMYRLSEGWAGGLQLLALASTTGKKPLIGTFQGLNKYVFDYLSNEILAAVDDEERQFLMHTSILNYFNANICNTLLERTDGRQLIHRIIEKNLFLVTIDEENETYRYHHLFGEFLRLKFSEIDRDTRRTLHLRAAEIYEQIGDLEESIKHFLAVKHYSDVLRIIQNIEQPVTAWTYLKQVPLHVMTDNKEMVFQRLFYHFCHMELDQCKVILDRLSDKINRDSAWKVFGLFKLFTEDDPAYFSDMTSLEELDRMPFNDVTKAIIYLTTSMLLSLRDQYDDALACIEKATHIERRMNNPYIRYFILSLKSQIKETLGELSECEGLYHALFRLAETHPFLAPLHGNSYIGAVGIYLKRMELDKAAQSLQRAEERINMSYPAVERGYLHNRMAFHLLKGEKKEAIALLNRLAAFPIFRDSIFSAELLKYRFYLDDVSTKQARDFIHLYDDYASSERIRFEDQLVYARAHFQGGNEKRALEVVDRVLKHTRKHAVKLPLIEGILLKIVILAGQTTASKGEMLNLIREAIHYSFDQHIFSPFILIGEDIRVYVQQLMAEREQDLSAREKNFIHRLVSMLERTPVQDMLSDREMEVMQVMATGATNKEIAQTLHISVATVKTHAINIFSKLHVSNRVEAVERARTLRLLE